MPARSEHNHDPAHDVLAAEEFGMPAPDPALHRDSAHDVLAAEEFGMPARDPVLNHGPVTLPDDPTGIVEPHDVLAAEEFALPAGHGGPGALGLQPLPDSRTKLLAIGALGLFATVLLRRRRS
jgi:hypothetical protein